MSKYFIHCGLFVKALSTVALAHAQSGLTLESSLIAQARPAAPSEPYNPPPSARSANRAQPGTLKVGDSLPEEFRNNQFVVDNLQQHGLPKPKAGTRWVGVSGDYLRVDSHNKIVEIRHASRGN